jgi:hypothetical protein
MLPQLNANLPAITYSDSIVRQVTTIGDTSTVSGTFRQVPPKF